MSRLLHEDIEVGAAWSASVSVAPPTTPSWLAPHLDSPPFLAARAGHSSAAPGPASASPSIRVVAPGSLPSVASPELTAPPLPPYPDLREEYAALRAQVAAQASALAEIRRAVLAASEGDLIGLACAVAERVARRELTVDPTLVVTWARDAVEALVTTDPIRLLVAPDLAAVVDEGAFREAIKKLGSVEIDPTLPSMGCEVHTRASRVEVSVDARLATIAEDLGVPRE